MNQPEILYIRDLAHLLGDTEAAIRSHIQRIRANPGQGYDALPQWFYRGRRLAWRRRTVMEWLDGRERKERPKGKVGRPRRVVTSDGSY